jgi:prepilin-type N-terminal cleavage/methylation domain-containing protein
VRTDRRPGGYTLIEMLVVIAIASTLMSIGVGVFLSLRGRNELEATTNAARALVRRARNAAREERAPALVELDSTLGEMRAATRETLTLFRFESDQCDGAPPPPSADDPPQVGKEPPPPEWEVKGSFSIQGHVFGADSVDGKLGQGLEFKRKGSYVSIPDRPSLSPIEGVALEMWIQPAKLEAEIAKKEDDKSTEAKLLKRIEEAGKPPCPTPPRAYQYWAKHENDPPLFSVVRKGSAFEVAITADYAVQVAVSGVYSGGPGASRTRTDVTYIARTENFAVRPEKWARLQFAFDGSELSCAVDGIRRALEPVKECVDTPLPERLVRDRSPLIFSDPDPERAFAGLLDEVKLQGVIRSERLKIPKNIALLAPMPEIHFDALGQLDPLRHAEPVVFWLTDSIEGLTALEPPAAPTGNKTVERKKVQTEERGVGRGEFDPVKAQRFANAIARVAPEKVKRVGVELTGSVTGDVR